ncbi:hypothetical protein ACFXKC_19515 [Streptomyces sp. NPDC059340]|uniref:hypothetical protein n=1 Tax=Streptomyces sp. NPDC059340 TaxID=3346806 RepID=UPI0036B05154
MTATSSKPSQPFKVLCSYAYFRSHNFGPLLESVHQSPALVFGDSGAHSARTLGISLPLDGYAAWCHRWDQHLALYANLDVIGAPEATWRSGSPAPVASPALPETARPDPTVATLAA